MRTAFEECVAVPRRRASASEGVVTSETAFGAKAIPDDEMGDVWPAVQPGSAPSDYGAAWLEDASACVVRSHQSWRLVYEAGRFGLDDTGGVRVALRWVHDMGPLQCDDPSAINHVSAHASNGTPIDLAVEPFGYRPWSYAVRATVSGGFLRPGDRILFTFGERGGGSLGLRTQTIAERRFTFRVSVDACATGQFAPLAEDLHLPIVAGPVARFVVVAPGKRRVGERFFLGVRAEDRWGNPSRPGDFALDLTSDGPIDGLPEKVKFRVGASAARIEGLSADRPGRFVFRLANAAGEVVAASNPLVVEDGDLAGYWGDLHGQSGETVGLGGIEEYMAFARDQAFLDVIGHQANDFQLTNAFWAKINAVTAASDQPGRFLAIPGYEWSANTPVGGDHNVFFRHEGRPIRRSSHAMLRDRSDLDSDANTLDALFAALGSEDCVLWAHVGGRPADVAYAHDPDLKTAVELHSNWGTFEWILRDSLALGHRVGVVANSDGHKGRQGASHPGATEFGAYGGLTCFLLEKLDRDHLFACMRARRHYATSGSRLHLDVRARFAQPARLFDRDPAAGPSEPAIASEAMMGAIVRGAGQEVALSVRVEAGAAIERIDLFDRSTAIATRRPFGADDLGRRVRVYWEGADYRGRSRNSFWRGVIDVEGAAIRAMTPINHWNPERPIERIGASQVTFEAVTSGNAAGVELLLDRADATIAVTSNLAEGRAALGSLGLEDAIFDAGGLERRLRVRRLPDVFDVASASETFSVSLEPDDERALWVRVTTADGHRAWSSPIYLEA